MLKEQLLQWFAQRHDAEQNNTGISKQSNQLASAIPQTRELVEPLWCCALDWVADVTTGGPNLGECEQKCGGQKYDASLIMTSSSAPPLLNFSRKQGQGVLD